VFDKETLDVAYFLVHSGLHFKTDFKSKIPRERRPQPRQNGPNPESESGWRPKFNGIFLLQRYNLRYNSHDTL